MNRFKQIAIVFMGVLSLTVAGATVLGTGVASAQQNNVNVCGAQSTGACNNFVNKYINPFVTLLTVVIGVGAAISIVVAGIQYASAGSDPGKVQKAKDRIWQTIIGLLAYIFLFSFLNYIIPGGLF